MSNSAPKRTHRCATVGECVEGEACFFAVFEPQHTTGLGWGVKWLHLRRRRLEGLA